MHLKKPYYLGGKHNHIQIPFLPTPFAVDPIPDDKAYADAVSIDPNYPSAVEMIRTILTEQKRVTTRRMAELIFERWPNTRKTTAEASAKKAQEEKKRNVTSGTDWLAIARAAKVRAEGTDQNAVIGQEYLEKPLPPRKKDLETRIREEMEDLKHPIRSVR